MFDVSLPPSRVGPSRCAALPSATSDLSVGTSSWRHHQLSSGWPWFLSWGFKESLLHRHCLLSCPAVSSFGVAVPPASHLPSSPFLRPRRFSPAFRLPLCRAAASHEVRFFSGRSPVPREPANHLVATRCHNGRVPERRSFRRFQSAMPSGAFPSVLATSTSPSKHPSTPLPAYPNTLARL